MNKRLFVVLLLVLAISSCKYRHGKHITGNGVPGTEQRNLTGFTGAETRGEIDIVVKQGDFSVKVEAEQNLLSYIETAVEHGRLIVRLRDGINLMDHHDAKVYVTAPVLTAFETHGSGKISSQGRIADKSKMDIQVAGSGDIQLDLDCPEIITATHGSGNIMLAGETKNLSCKISGSGNVEAANLKAENVKVSIHGSGNTAVFASESLDTDISGSGNVHYKGDPKINNSTHGSGSVTRME
ncbi:MAG: head GIN domain-containing protein [Chitinophagaceae bacterium]